MLIKSKFFGEIDIDEKELITFEEGILGFPDLSKYIVLREEDNDYFSYLQAIEDESVCFIMTSPYYVTSDYSIDISDDAVKKLEIKAEGDVILFSIVTVPEDMRKMTANLRAPLIVNIKKRKGLQEVIDNEGYSIKHRIVKED